jgi:hypothetical protein
LALLGERARAGFLEQLALAVVAAPLAEMVVSAVVAPDAAARQQLALLQSLVPDCGH